MKNFTGLKDVNDLPALLADALYIKNHPYQNQLLGKNQTLGLVFLNPSLRTRLSTQRAALNLGMNVMVMNLNNEGWSIEYQDGAIMDQGTQEHIREAAAVISQYCDVIGIRTFSTIKDRDEDYNETILTKFIQHAKVPVISLESAIRHPLQSFADVITVEEFKPVKRPKVVLTWAPHPKPLPQAVANSFSEWMRAAEVDLVITNPEGFDLSPEFTEGVTVTHNQNEALEGAHFVYAKNWSSFADYGKTGLHLRDWTITAEKMSLTANGYFMHCLPVRRNVVVADAVIDSDRSLVLQQANNRTYAAQTVLQKVLQNV